jgi:hypothetical protein
MIGPVARRRAALGGLLRHAPDDYVPMRLPPFPFPPPPDEPAEQANVSDRADSSLLAAAIAAGWALCSVGSMPVVTVLNLVMLVAPIGVVALLGWLLGKQAACGRSVVSLTFGMAFGSVYAVFLLILAGVWFEFRGTPEAVGVVVAFLVFGTFFALFGLTISAPSAVAWALLTREIFGPRGTLRHLARRTRRICVFLIAAALLLIAYKVATVPWVLFTEGLRLEP